MYNINYFVIVTRQNWCWKSEQMLGRSNGTFATDTILELLRYIDIIKSYEYQIWIGIPLINTDECLRQHYAAHNILGMSIEYDLSNI